MDPGAGRDAAGGLRLGLVGHLDRDHAGRGADRSVHGDADTVRPADPGAEHADNDRYGDHYAVADDYRNPERDAQRDGDADRYGHPNGDTHGDADLDPEPHGDPNRYAHRNPFSDGDGHGHRYADAVR